MQLTSDLEEPGLPGPPFVVPPAELMVGGGDLEGGTTLGSGEKDEFSIESERCGICLDMIIDRGVLDCCNDWFCFTCIDNWATITNLCPLCKSEFQLITCLPVYDALGNFMEDQHLSSTSRDNDDWVIQEKNNALSFPSYYISEEAVKCLDGDGCKIRSGLPLSAVEEDLILDTSIACDSCDVWYHAFCVGFDPQDQLGNSWLCPRCITDQVPQKHIQKTADIGNTIQYTFSSKVSISVADEGETALVVSMIDDQQPSEATNNFGEVNQVEVSNAYDFEGPFPDDNADIEKPSIVEVSTDTQRICSNIMPINEMPSEPVLEVKALGSSLAIPLSEASSVSLPIESASFDFDHQLSAIKVPEFGKHVGTDTSVGSPLSDGMVADHASKAHVGTCDHEVIDSEPTGKNQISDGVKDEGIKRLRDPHSNIPYEKDFKKHKVDTLPQTKQLMRTCTDDTKMVIKTEAAFTGNKFPSSLGTNSAPLDIMRIVRGIKKKPITITEGVSSGDKAKGDNVASCLRVRKIMHIAGKQTESTDLVQKLTKQIKEAVSSNPSNDLSRSVPSDNKLLEAFRGAISRSQTKVTNTNIPSNLRANKPLQRGKVRENLTKKIYKTNGRLRRAWNRDCEIEFWKHRCLKSKPNKVEALQSVLDILKGITSSPGESSSTQELKWTVENSILSRLYIADASVLPRTEEIKPLSDIVGSPATSVDGQYKGHYLNNSSKKESHPVLGTKNSLETASSVKRATLEITSSACREKLSFIPAAGISKTNLQPLAKEDKRKWALEVLARKNATSDGGKDKEKQDHLLIKEKFPLLAQLPLDMRPNIEPCQRSKVPVSVRQVQLNRLTELYLRRANLPVICKTAATELAVADAINIEKDIFQRSKSKLVYVNLCSQHITNLQALKNEKLDTEHSTSHHEDVQLLSEHAGSNVSSTCDITEVLKQTGLLSDTPPESPSGPIQSPNTKDFVVANVGTDAFENILDMDCSSTDIDIYKDFEYDLEDEAYNISKSLYTVASDVQSDVSKLKMKVVLSTLDSEKPSEELEDVSTCGDQQATQSFNCSFSSKEDVPACQSDVAKLSPPPHIEVAGCSSAVDPADKEVLWEDCDELYGPEQKHLESGSSGNDSAHAKDVTFEEDSNKLKNEPSVTCCGGAKNSGSKHAEKGTISSQLCGNESASRRVHENEFVPTEGEQFTASNQEPSTDTVSQKVEVYVKEHIRPLFKSGIITAEQYRWSVMKTRDKVMKYHCKAKNANFLIKEGDKVKKLAQQYVEAASKQKDLMK